MSNKKELPKIAIMLIGHIRSWNTGCRESFMNKFNKYKPDVYVITYDTIDYKSDAPKLASEQIRFFLRDINVVKLQIKDENDVFEESKKYENFQNVEDKMSFRKSLCQYINLRDCFKMIEDSKKKYDYVVKTRFDLCYHFDEDIFREYGQIFTSNGHCCCDFFACSDLGRMAHYSSYIDNLENIYTRYLSAPEQIINPHIILHYHLLGGYTNNIHVEKLQL